ncbi:hypothetical protein CAC42_2358 [Sphaceloma murrayae]|uniref:Uncharacterized protein n=1 Tax=Sphaceloma murrayae TaxID=2082308 RepID=A0A2K1QJR1_9PEZI|nr:hypothetical protein CAC42_2358 [Sphaceloma murrayae]
MDQDYLSSSPDPISILANSSPAKPKTAGTPIRPKPKPYTSPTKSVLLDARDPNGGSPWRIKVTVEAEAGTAVDRSVRKPSARASRTITVPIKGPDDVSPIKRRGRPRKMNMTGSADTHSDTRGKTPPRRRSKRTARPTDQAHALSKNFSRADEEAVLCSAPTHELSTATALDDLSGNSDMTRASAIADRPSSQASVPVHSRQNRSSLLRSSTVADDVEPKDAYLVGEQSAAGYGDATIVDNEDFSMISVESLNSHRSHTKVATRDTTQGQNTSRTDASLSYMPSSPPAHPYIQRTPQIMQTPQPPQAPPQPVISVPHLMTPLRESVVRSGKVLQDIVRSPEREHAGLSGRSSSGNLFAGFSVDTRRQLRKSLQMGAALAQEGSDHQPRSSPLLALSGSSGVKYPALDIPKSDHRLPTPEEREDVRSASTLSSGPPAYPQISPSMKHSVSIVEPATNTSRKSYDMMSWVQTGPTSLSSPAGIGHKTSATNTEALSSRAHNIIQVPSDTSDESNEEDEEDDEDDEEDEEDEQDVDKQEQALASLGEAHSPSMHHHSTPPDIEDNVDIWQEEASRSIEEDEAGNQVSALLEGPVRPRRSKLPGTWRRTSGNHFHYSDSPEPEAVQPRKSSSTESSGKDEGVVTPPTTDDEDDEEVQADPYDSFQEDEHKAADHGTEVYDDQDGEEDSASLLSDLASTNDDDTGLFFQSNFPNVFQGQRGGRNTTELSLLSELKPVSSPAKPRDNSMLKQSVVPARSPVKMRQVEGDIHSSKPHSSILSSPLRKSLLRSSKIGGSPVSKTTIRTFNVRPEIVQEGQEESTRQFEESQIDNVSDQSDENGEATPDESEEEQDYSVASDTRQLLSEMAAHTERSNRIVVEGDPETGEDDWSHEEQSDINTTYLNGSRSYVEKLNLSSPTKIAVKFNDSSAVLQSTPTRPVLSPEKKRYHALFQDDAPLGESVQSEHDDDPYGDPFVTTTNGPKTAAEEPKSIISMMTNSFWSAITSKSSPTKAPRPEPEPESSPQSTSSQAEGHSSSRSEASTQATSASLVLPVPRDSTTVPGTHQPDALLRLRRKYGLLSPSHPFTLHHARTLHRLWNSIDQHPSTTLLPSTSVLPLLPALLPLQDETFTSSTFHTSLPFSDDHLRAVNAFMHLLLPDEERDRLERNGKWGDDMAERARGWDKRGRHGTWFAFGGEGRGDRNARGMRGEIEARWVAGVLGEVRAKEGRRSGGG